MGSKDQRRDDAGFSIEKNRPRLERTRQHSAVNKANSSPNCSFANALSIFVTFVRAMLQTQHGVPKCTYQIRPAFKTSKTANCVCLRDKS